MKPVWIFLLGGLLMFASDGAMAQSSKASSAEKKGGQTSPKKPSLVMKTGKWKKTCPDEKKSACLMQYQVLTDEEKPQFIFAIVIGSFGTDKIRIRLVTPLGVRVDRPVQMQIVNKGQVYNVQIAICGPQLCETLPKDMPPSLVSEMKAGRTLLVQYHRLGPPLSFRIPLAGFSAIYNTL